jgi:hypothetical protein
MEHNLIETLAEQLRKQRKHYLEAFRKAEEGLESIAAERESELEEHAQEEQSARVLNHLNDVTLRRCMKWMRRFNASSQVFTASAKDAAITYPWIGFAFYRQPGAVRTARRETSNKPLLQPQNRRLRQPRRSRQI